MPKAGLNSKAPSKSELPLLESLLGQKSLKRFIQYVWPLIEPSPFIDGMPIDAMVEHLEAVTQGEIKRLIINIPPRHTKSTILVIWRVWSWLHNPAERILGASYSLALSIRDNMRVRRIVEDPWFSTRFSHLFSLASDQNVKGYFENNKQGYQMALSVDGGTTGQGGSILVLDDAHNADEAHSEADRTRAVSWFREVWTNRLNNQETDKMVVVGQRIHQEDVCGYIISERPDWVHLNLPALYEPHRHCKTPIWTDPRKEEGDLLWPERFSQATLAGLKRDLGSQGFAAQYQQIPVPSGGGQFKAQWFRSFVMNDGVCALDSGVHVPLNQCRTFVTVDLAISSKQSSDFTAICYWALTPGADLLLHDCLCAHLDNPSQQRILRSWYDRYHPDYFLIESVAYQLAFVQQLRRMGLPVREYRPVKDKVSRASTASVYYEAGQIFHLRGGNWVADFETELLQFPMGAHDDRVDNVSMAATQIRRSSSGMIMDYEEKDEIKKVKMEEEEYEEDENMIFWR